MALLGVSSRSWAGSPSSPRRQSSPTPGTPPRCVRSPARRRPRRRCWSRRPTPSTGFPPARALHESLGGGERYPDEVPQSGGSRPPKGWFGRRGAGSRRAGAACTVDDHPHLPAGGDHLGPAPAGVHGFGLLLLTPAVWAADAATVPGGGPLDPFSPLDSLKVLACRLRQVEIAAGDVIPRLTTSSVMEPLFWSGTGCSRSRVRSRASCRRSETKIKAQAPGQDPNALEGGWFAPSRHNIRAVWNAARFGAEWRLPAPGSNAWCPTCRRRWRGRDPGRRGHHVSGGRVRDARHPPVLPPAVSEVGDPVRHRLDGPGRSRGGSRPTSGALCCPA